VARAEPVDPPVDEASDEPLAVFEALPAKITLETSLLGEEVYVASGGADCEGLEDADGPLDCATTTTGEGVARGEGVTLGNALVEALAEALNAPLTLAELPLAVDDNVVPAGPALEAVALGTAKTAAEEDGDADIHGVGVPVSAAEPVMLALASALALGASPIGAEECESKGDDEDNALRVGGVEPVAEAVPSTGAGDHHVLGVATPLAIAEPDVVADGEGGAGPQVVQDALDDALVVADGDGSALREASDVEESRGVPLVLALVLALVQALAEGTPPISDAEDDNVALP
jgi:hypothetical protein